MIIKSDVIKMIKTIIKSLGILSLCFIINRDIVFASCQNDGESNQYCPGDVVITEIFSQPSDIYKIHEYIELYNTTDETITLTNWTLNINDNPLTISIGDEGDEFKINSHDDVILYGYQGKFTRSSGETVCTSINPPDEFLSNCEEKLSFLYWLKFSNMPHDELEIKLYDNNSLLIDSVGYNENLTTWAQIIGDNNFGKSLEFILDPRLNGYLLNDDPFNWRLSQYQGSSNFLVSDNQDYGSPIFKNFLDVDILSQAINSDTSYYDTSTELFVHSPVSDGYPGGDVDLKITFEFKSEDEGNQYDSIRWDLFNIQNQVLDTNRTDSVWNTVAIVIDTIVVLDTHRVNLFLRDPDGIMTSKDVEI